MEAVSVETIANQYGWKVGQLPITYLGYTLGGNPRRLSFWEPMLEKVRMKSRSFNSKFISLSGRLVLLKAAINSIPIFWMSIFKAPKGVIKKIEMAYRAFLWGYEDHGRRTVWIPWELICKNRDLGGLGLGFIGWKNKALLLKWAWRYGTELDCLWRRVLVAKYNLDPKAMLLHTVVGKNWSPLMQDILSALKEDNLLSKGVTNHLICKVGCGKNIRLWHDPWADLEPLHLKFPRLFAMATNKNILIEEAGVFVRGKWIWDIGFRRQFFDWESQMLSEFNSLINSVFPAEGKQDSLIWCINEQGTFSIKMLCHWAEYQVWEEPTPFMNDRTSKVIPPKASLLFWQANHNKLATKQNLVRRGILNEEEGLCVLCGHWIESNNHLFLLCPVIWRLWGAVLCREKVTWVIPNSLLQLAIEWPHLVNTSDSKLWEIIPCAMTWAVWVARNAIIFKGEAFNSQQVWDDHILKIALWIKGSNQVCPYSFNQVFNNFCGIRIRAIPKPPRSSNWIPPSPGLLKFNVDGASKGNPGASGMGGVLRSPEQTILGYFALNAGVMKAFEVEVHAILNALLFCQDFLFKNIIIESDCANAVGWTKSKENRPWRLLNILNQIDFLCSEVNCLEIRHIFREANSEPDQLANMGCNRVAPLWVCVEDDNLSSIPRE